MRRIIVTEEQFKKYIIGEGVEWTANDDGSANIRINSKSDDKSNTYGNMSVDTRVFGTKNDILHGDNTWNKPKSLTQKYKEKLDSIKFYESVIAYIKNGKKGDIYITCVNGKVARILEISGLYRVAKTAEAVEDALDLIEAKYCV